MTNTLSKVFIFTAGAAIGSAATWYLLKTKYEQIAQEEIDSVKETFSRLNSNPTEDTDDQNVPVEKEPEQYEQIAQNYGKYCKKEEVEEVMKKPYIITPEECGEIEDYDVISLIYFADKVLTDDQNVPIENVDEIVGRDSLNHFGECEDDPDSVFVRNDELRTDIEILLDSRNYSDLVNDVQDSTEE